MCKGNKTEKRLNKKLVGIQFQFPPCNKIQTFALPSLEHPYFQAEYQSDFGLRRKLNMKNKCSGFKLLELVI